MRLRQVGEEVWVDTARVIAVVPSLDRTGTTAVHVTHGDTYQVFHSLWSSEKIAQAIGKQDG